MSLVHFVGGAIFLFGQCFATNEGEQLLLQCTSLGESSGVCVTAGGQIIWSHNDSGDQARVFGFDSQGRLIRTIHLSGVQAEDWEDICSFDIQGDSYLAVADAGDNQRRRASVQIYILKIPEVDRHSTDGLQQLDTFTQLNVTYPDGPVDCEGLAYDPKNKVFLLASKEAFRCRLFEVDAIGLWEQKTLDKSGVDVVQPTPGISKHDLQAKHIGTIVLPMITGADISRDGKRMVLSTYGPGCMIYRDEGGSGQWEIGVENAIQFFDLPVRKQGESVCFDLRGERLLLTSEFAPTPLFSIPCPAAPLDLVDPKVPANPLNR